MKFLALAYGAEADWIVLSKERQDELLAQDQVLLARGAEIGAVLPPTTVRNWDGDNPTTSDGPISSSSVPLAGFGLIEADSIEEAIELVSHTPCAVARGAVEVWPIMGS